MGRPGTSRLAGTYEELSDDAASTDIERATRIEHEHGGIDFLIHQTTPDYPWEARLTAQPGSREFTGHMWSSEWDGRYDVRVQLWLSPDDDELLLLGTCWSDDEEEVAIKIVLWEEDE